MATDARSAGEPAEIDPRGEVRDERAAAVIGATARVADRREEEVDVAVDDDEVPPIDALCPGGALEQ